MSDDASQTWLTPWRLRVYPRALFLATCIALAVTLLASSGATTATGRLGGDFPAFYSAGEILLRGTPEDLFDWDAQARLQEDLLPGESGVLPFVYPPFFALPYAPLALLPYPVAWAVHTVVLMGLLYLAIRGMAEHLPRVHRYRFSAFSLAFAFYPMFRSISGAQNTVFTLLLVVATWRLLAAGRTAMAGAPTSLILFKPQLAVPALGLVVVRHPRALLTAVPVTLGLWGISAVMTGPNWIAEWWAPVAAFQARDQGNNASNSVGLLGITEGTIGPGTALGLGLGALLVGALVLALLWVWRPGSKVDLRWRMAALTCGLVLVPPHLMYYDAGLLVLPLAVLGDHYGRAAIPWLSLAALGGLAAVLSPWTGINAVFFVAVATTLAVFRAIVQEAS